MKRLELNDLKRGMVIQVLNRYSSNRQKGIVSKVEETITAKMIDGKPVSKRKVTEVEVTYTQGEAVVLNPDNIRNYEITKI